jgi:hypothetical protein
MRAEKIPPQFRVTNGVLYDPSRCFFQQLDIACPFHSGRRTPLLFSVDE